jgi:DNA-binding transcriptional LysR family regulator
MVEAGLGVAFMHELSTRKRFAKVRTYPFRPKVERTIGLYTAHANSISPATKEMRKTIIDYAKRP